MLVGLKMCEWALPSYWRTNRTGKLLLHSKCDHWPNVTIGRFIDGRDHAPQRSMRSCVEQSRATEAVSLFFLGIHAFDIADDYPAPNAAVNSAADKVPLLSVSASAKYSVTSSFACASC